MASAQQNFHERRIIIVGKTGNGKSSTANSLFGNKLFPAGRGLTGKTQTCLKQMQDTQFHFRYVVVDTPGIFDMGMPLAQLALEIQRSVVICPNPHAFFLVFSAASRFTEEEILTVEMLQVIFGEEVFDHCIIVFTHGDEFENEEDFKTFWTEADFLTRLVERCGGRITSTENKSRCGHYPNRDNILTLVEMMCISGKRSYQSSLINCHRAVLEEHLKTYEGNKSAREELAALVEKLNKQLKKEIRRQRMINAVGGVAAFGLGIGLCYLAGTEMILTTVLGVVMKS